MPESSLHPFSKTLRELELELKIRELEHELYKANVVINNQFSTMTVNTEITADIPHPIQLSVQSDCLFRNNYGTWEVRATARNNNPKKYLHYATYMEDLSRITEKDLPYYLAGVYRRGLSGILEALKEK